MSTHSLFSPSSSSRWLNCPAAATLAQRYPNPTNPAADEGALAHSLAERFLVYGYTKDNITRKEFASILEGGVSKEMVDNVNQYVEYCRDIHHGTYRTLNGLNVEVGVDFSRYAPGGYGTSDAIIFDYSGGKIHVLDLKYGRVRVDARENTQLMLYALGSYSCMPDAHKEKISEFVLHICQPRVFNGFSTHTISVEELLAFGETVKEKSALALADNPERIAGEEQCKWCPARGDCSALAEYSKDVVMFDFDGITNEAVLPDIEKLTSEQRKSILDNQATIIAFMKAVSDSARSDIESGKTVEGYKLVEGRSRRQWLDTAQDALIEKLGDKATATKTITITEAQKLLSKKEVDNLTFKKAGGATLVRDSDKRPALENDVTFDVIEKTKSN